MVKQIITKNLDQGYNKNTLKGYLDVDNGSDFSNQSVIILNSLLME